MWDEDSSPNKAEVRWEKIAFALQEMGRRRSKVCYLGLPADRAILEDELVRYGFNPENLYLLEKNRNVFNKLSSNVKRGRLNGAKLFNQDMREFVDSYNESLPKFSVIDLDFCGLPNKTNLSTILGLAKNGLLSKNGVLFANFCKGHDSTKEVGQIIATDSVLKESLGLKNISRIITREDRKPQLDIFREMFIPNYLARKFAQYGYRLKVEGNLQEYADGPVYMHQWTFTFQRQNNPLSLASYKSNLARKRMRIYRKDVRRKVK